MRRVRAVSDDFGVTIPKFHNVAVERVRILLVRHLFIDPIKLYF
jgi:hypothetical protein